MPFRRPRIPFPLIPISDVQVVRLDPGAVVLLRCATAITPEQAVTLKGQWMAATGFPNKVVVLDSGTGVDVLAEAPPPPPPPPGDPDYDHEGLPSPPST